MTDWSRAPKLWTAWGGPWCGSVVLPCTPAPADGWVYQDDSAVWIPRGTGTRRLECGPAGRALGCYRTESEGGLWRLRWRQIEWPVRPPAAGLDSADPRLLAALDDDSWVPPALATPSGPLDDLPLDLLEPLPTDVPPELLFTESWFASPLDAFTARRAKRMLRLLAALVPRYGHLWLDGWMRAHLAALIDRFGQDAGVRGAARELVDLLPDWWIFPPLDP